MVCLQYKTKTNDQVQSIVSVQHLVRYKIYTSLSYACGEQRMNEWQIAMKEYAACLECGSPQHVCYGPALPEGCVVEGKEGQADVKHYLQSRILLNACTHARTRTRTHTHTPHTHTPHTHTCTRTHTHTYTTHTHTTHAHTHAHAHTHTHNCRRCKHNTSHTCSLTC